ncbi:MAG: SUMF1/EgtB/PvdO family nonheme iron enzyme [Cyanobacteria bacterium P01_D01_bin.116]
MGRNWAIAIGINHYDNLQPLKYAQQDAEAMKDWFTQEAKFDKVFLFTEDSPPIRETNPPIPTQPTYARFQRFLDVQFERRLLKPEDNLWFFFAGHGRRYADQDYLMFLDSNPQAVDRTAISVDYVTQRLRRSGADNVVLFIDACRDEGSRSGLGIGQQEFKGVVTFYSCAANQKSWEIDELEHGSFTHTLLEGLRIQGEANCATVERLEQHLRYHVPILNARYRKPGQKPCLKAEPPYKMYYILLEKVATLRDAESLKYQASQAENRDNLELAEQLWKRVIALPGVDEDAIAAINRIYFLRQRQPLLEKCRQLFSCITTRMPISRRGFLRWAGFGVGALVIEVLVRSTTPLPEISPSPSTKPISPEKFKFEVVTVNSQGEITSRLPCEAELFKENLGNDVTLEMVSIPGGFFKMGTEDKEIERVIEQFHWTGHRREKPARQVTVGAFFMGKFEVTQEQYQQVMGYNPSEFKGNKRPVENVSWDDAVEFCKRLSYLTGRTYRLPSEAEWEYACRARTTTPFHFGETITTNLANYRGTDRSDNKGRLYPGNYGDGPKGEYRQQTTEVNSFPPNRFGLYDMHGNVWEWCQDHWPSNYKVAPKDGSAWINDDDENKRILRGGSWIDNPGYCRSASRPDNKRSNGARNGLRVVCEVAPRTLKWPYTLALLPFTLLFFILRRVQERSVKKIFFKNWVYRRFFLD